MDYLSSGPGFSLLRTIVGSMFRSIVHENTLQRQYMFYVRLPVNGWPVNGHEYG